MPSRRQCDARATRIRAGTREPVRGNMYAFVAAAMKVPRIDQLDVQSALPDLRLDLRRAAIHLERECVRSQAVAGEGRSADAGLMDRSFDIHAEIEDVER